MQPARVIFEDRASDDPMVDLSVENDPQLPKVVSPTPNIEKWIATSIYLYHILQHIDTYLTILREKQIACPANYNSLIIYHRNSLFGELSHYWKWDFIKRGQVENFNSDSYVCPDS
ncbi:hypothetical protein ACOSQ2_017082 [Xanthoceras sorbifolium]